ncbi:MAG: beta-ketoacyl-[acyl-carrier-protein] synthase family protein [Flavobacteriales bacterium]|nr:beta-ketoacyl-[acyl-carrier-protein] synthase family protein [Flavobacteriales bacterium]MCX7768483.1 beta-ketoacyl-[acyl-carrier-protein] synthase family protein [Flavobacteriales bacterium]MDW8409816.1 beta-ketoacyl-[acyl-carrier-protein] synthase family protein [Flavobacteriales bacterium]
MKAGEVWVTGMGIVTALGLTLQEHLERLKAGQSGIGPPRILRTRHTLPVGEVPHNDAALTRMLGSEGPLFFVRTALLGTWAARQALQQAGIHLQDVDPATTGFISSTTVGGMTATEEYFYRYEKEEALHVWIDKLDCGDSTRDIACYLGHQGFSTTLSTACSSSANAIMLGARLIKAGRLKRVLCGGADALCRFTLNGFHSLMLTEKVPCRPFDKHRQGLNLGEGAAFLVLEDSREAERRGAQPLARVAGYANTNDAFHQTASSPEGEAAYEAMKQALAMAGIPPEKVSYVNTHGTGTPNNDESEGRALCRLFGQNLPPFSSTKPFTGHTLAAAGAVEAVFSILAIQEGQLWPNLNFTEPMDDPSIVPVLKTTSAPVRTVVSNSFGFGGNNTSLVITAVS